VTARTFARGAIAAALLAAPCGCGGDEEEDDTPRFACRYNQHAFTLCTGGSHTSSDTAGCAMVRSQAACDSLTKTTTTCTTDCCTDRTYSSVSFSQGSC